MKTMRPLVLVDFSNLCFACWYPAVSANKADPKYDTIAVYKNNLDGKLSTLARTLNEVGTHDFRTVFVEDRKSLRKYALWPSYKANRPPLEYDPRPVGKEHLKSQGWGYYAFSPDNEADDAIATLAAKLVVDRDIVICSSDKDLWQLKRPGVDIWQLTKDRFVTDEMIVEEFGVYQTSQIPIVKALWGDSGDNVPNAVPRMQKQLMPYVLDAADLDCFFKNQDGFTSTTKRCQELIKAGRDQVLLNHQLVKLDENCNLELEEP